MLRRLVEIFLSIPAPLAVAAVFLVTAGETAFFLGLVLPGELAVILGGVLASQARVPLLAVLLAGVIGPITGDSIGYFLGRRYGRRFFSGRRRKRWAKARAWLARWEAFAVFLGRFTAFLRSIIPAAAGAARLPYRRFLPWNVAAGVLWGVGSVMLGYFAGRNYETLAHRASLLSLALFVLLLAAALVSFFRRRKRAGFARARRSRRAHASRSRG